MSNIPGVVIGGVSSGGGGGSTTVADGSITTAKLADNAVTRAKIGTAAVGEAEIGVNAVSNAKLADDSVNTDEVATASVTGAKLADGAVTSAKIADSSITTAKLADGAVNYARIQNVSELGVFIGNNFNNAHGGRLEEITVPAAKNMLDVNHSQSNVSGQTSVSFSNGNNKFISLSADFLPTAITGLASATAIMTLYANGADRTVNKPTTAMFTDFTCSSVKWSLGSDSTFTLANGNYAQMSYVKIERSTGVFDVVVAVGEFE